MEAQGEKNLQLLQKFKEEIDLSGIPQNEVVESQIIHLEETLDILKIATFQHRIRIASWNVKNATTNNPKKLKKKLKQ